MAKFLIKWFQVVVLAGGLGLAVAGWSDESSSMASGIKTERPGYHVILADLIFVRPLALIATALGSVIFVATLPFTVATGTPGEAGMTLVVVPGANVFVRCLGCTEIGWRKLPQKEM